MYFIYGEAELAYLRRKDKRLAAVIDRIGWSARRTLICFPPSCTTSSASRSP